MRQLLLLTVLTLGTACTDIFAPMPGNPELFAPPAVYARYYAEVEACSGIKGDFARVRWYRYGGEYLPTGMGISAGKVGHAWRWQHKIAITSNYLSNPTVIRHEALHDLMARDGHPTKYFGAFVKNDPSRRNWKGGQCSHLV